MSNLRKDVYPDTSRIPVPSTAGEGEPSNIPKIIGKMPISNSDRSNTSNTEVPNIESDITDGPFANLNPVIQNQNGYDVLKFNLSPETTLLTNQDTITYMDGGLTTNVTLGSGGIFGAFFRGVTGSSIIQNMIINSTKNTLKLALSPIMQGSIVQINIKAGETWRFADKTFIACTPNLNVSGNINIFQNFTMLFAGQKLTYTTIKADKNTDGIAWISSYGAVEKHEMQMGTNSTCPLYINHGCFLGMLDSDPKTNYWNKYVRVGLPSDLLNSMFSSLGFVMKIQDTNPPSGNIKVIVYTQSLNQSKFEKYIATIAQKAVANNTRASIQMGGFSKTRKHLKKRVI
jgi:hypothetical protein